MEQPKQTHFFNSKKADGEAKALPECVKVGFKRTDKALLPEVTLERNKASEPAPVVGSGAKDHEKQLTQTTVQKSGNLKPFKEGLVQSGAKLFRRGFAHETANDPHEESGLKQSDSKPHNLVAEKKVSGDKIAVLEGKSASDLKPTIHMQPPLDSLTSKGKDGNFVSGSKVKDSQEDSRPHHSGRGFKDRQYPTEGRSSGFDNSKPASGPATNKPFHSNKGPQNSDGSQYEDEESNDHSDLHKVDPTTKQQSNVFPSTSNDFRNNFTKTASNRRYPEDEPIDTKTGPFNDARRKPSYRNVPHQQYHHPHNRPAPYRRHDSSQQEEYVMKESEQDRKPKAPTGGNPQRPERKIDFGDNPFQLLNPK